MGMALVLSWLKEPRSITLALASFWSIERLGTATALVLC
jgi:hypothetical protein